MSTAWIGAYNFIALHGSINGMQERLEEISRPGIDGVSFRAIGERADVSNLQTERDMLLKSSRKIQLAAYESLVGGSPVTIIDNQGNVWNNMIVRSVSEVRFFENISATGGLETNPQAFQKVNWEVQQV